MIKQKKHLVIVTIVIFIVSMSLFGGKIYMNSQEKQLLEQERQIALQAKEMFKDIKEMDLQAWR